jgi:hypothetical protein
MIMDLLEYQAERRVPGVLILEVCNNLQLRGHQHNNAPVGSVKWVSSGMRNALLCLARQ